MAVSNQILVVRGVTRFINRLYSSVSSIGMKFSGLLKTASLRFGSLNVGDATHPVYLKDGVPTACKKLLPFTEYSYTTTRPSGDGLFKQSSPSGTRGELVVDGGLYMYTSPSASSTSGLELYSLYNGSYANTYLNNMNWHNYIDLGKTVVLNNGRVSFQYSGTEFGYCTMNQEDSNTFDIPAEVAIRTVDNGYTSSFRTQTKGDSSDGNYLSLCANSVGDKYMPRNAPSLTWGRSNTHTYLSVSPITKGAYMGAGSSNSLTWRGEIAFAEDMPNGSQFMDTNGNLNTTTSFAQLRLGVTASNSDTNRPYGMYDGFAYGYLDDDDMVIIRGTGGGWWKVPMTYFDTYVAAKRLVYHQIQAPLAHYGSPLVRYRYVYNPDESPVFITPKQTNKDDEGNDYYDIDMHILASSQYLNSSQELARSYEIGFIHNVQSLTHQFFIHLVLEGFVIYDEDFFGGVTAVHDHVIYPTLPSGAAVGDTMYYKIRFSPRTSSTTATNITTTITKL